MVSTTSESTTSSKPSITAYRSAVPIRTPPRLSVESLRPLITNEPRGVARTQSPCRQRPGKSAK